MSITIAVLPPVLLLGIYRGRFMEQYKMQNDSKYFISTYIDNNLKYSEADRNERCQQSYNLYIDKGQLNVYQSNSRFTGST